MILIRHATSSSSSFTAGSYECSGEEVGIHTSKGSLDDDVLGVALGRNNVLLIIAMNGQPPGYGQFVVWQLDLPASLRRAMRQNVVRVQMQLILSLGSITKIKRHFTIPLPPPTFT